MLIPVFDILKKEKRPNSRKAQQRAKRDEEKRLVSNEGAIKA